MTTQYGVPTPIFRGGAASFVFLCGELSGLKAERCLHTTLFFSLVYFLLRKISSAVF